MVDTLWPHMVFSLDCILVCFNKWVIILNCFEVWLNGMDYQTDSYQF